MPYYIFSFQELKGFPLIINSLWEKSSRKSHFIISFKGSLWSYHGKSSRMASIYWYPLKLYIKLNKASSAPKNILKTIDFVFPTNLVWLDLFHFQEKLNFLWTVCVSLNKTSPPYLYFLLELTFSLTETRTKKLGNKRSVREGLKK